MQSHRYLAVLLVALAIGVWADCTAGTDCVSCGKESDCVWCADQRTCVSGSIVGPTGGNCTKWQYKQCLVDGIVGLVIGGVAILVILGVIVAVVVVCCCCRKEERISNDFILYDARLDDKGQELEEGEADFYDQEAQRTGSERDQLILDYMAAADDDQGTSQHHTAHALNLLRNGSREEAREYFEKALEINKHDFMARACLMYILAKRGVQLNEDDILKLGKEGVALIGSTLDASHIAFYTIYATFEELTDRIDAAEKHWIALLGGSTSEANTRAWGNAYGCAGIFYMNTRDEYDTAVKYLQKALERDPENPRWQKALKIAQKKSS